MDMDSILKRLGVSYEELTSSERDTLLNWMDQASTQGIQVEDVKTNISALIEGVQLALVSEPEYEYHFFGLLSRENRQHLFLKARLKNYLLLQAFIESPDRAKKALDAQLRQLKPLKSV